MKKRIVVLSVCLAIVLILSIGLLAINSWRGNIPHLIEHHGTTLRRIAENGLYRKEPSDSERALLAWYGVESVHLEEDRVLFFLETHLPEGYECLIYTPDDGYTPRCFGRYEDWTPVETQDGSLRWEGGMMGKAYVNLWKLSDNFYLEEAYLPT